MGSFQATIGTKISKQGFSHKNSIRSILNHYNTVTLCRDKILRDNFFMKLGNPHFGPIWAPSGKKNLKPDFPKKKKQKKKNSSNQF